jgi:cytochrome c oxidase accessory protein FixG
MTGSGSIQRFRRAAGAAQAILFVGLPFVRVGGESALRFDVPTLTLHALGAAVGVGELFVTLPAVVFLTLLLLLVTVSFGRAWCGWSCPQTVLGDLTRLVQPWTGRVPRPWRRAAGFALTALVSVVAGAATVWYFVPATEFLGDLVAGHLGPVAAGAWAALSLVLFLDLALVRGRFCATACPYARLQGVLYDAHTLTVAYDARRDADCIDCGACVRCCPTGIDIRDGAQMECIACAECIDACRPIMLKLKRAPDLVGYFFGEPGRPRRLVRPATVGLLVATLLSLGATAAAARTVAGAGLDLTVVVDSGFSPRRAPDGRVLNAYVVSLENRTTAPLALRLSMAAEGLEVALRPPRVALEAGQHLRLRVVAEARGPAGRRDATLTATATDAAGHAMVRSSRAFLDVPESP